MVLATQAAPEERVQRVSGPRSVNRYALGLAIAINSVAGNGTHIDNAKSL